MRYAIATGLILLFVYLAGMPASTHAQELLASTSFDPAYDVTTVGRDPVLPFEEMAVSAPSANGLPIAETVIAGQLATDPTSAEMLVLKSGWILELFPFGRLWEPPLANQHEPRVAAKLREENGATFVSTTLGAVFPVLGRLRPPDAPAQGVQVDFFAVVFTELDGDISMASADYRVGLPVTAAINRWQFKLAFEHSSSHVADTRFVDWISGASPVYPRKEVVRDEAVFGVARRFGDATRVYGQFAYNFTRRLHYGNDKGVRLDWGVEWTPSSVSFRDSGPYVALDMEFRGQQSLAPATTVQIGWQRRTLRSISSSVRVAAEYYDGPSPWGQSFLDHESWWALTLAYDW